MMSCREKIPTNEENCPAIEFKCYFHVWNVNLNQSATGALSCYPFVIIIIITSSCGAPPPSCPAKNGNPCILQIVTWLELKLCCRSTPAQAKMVIGEFLCLLLWTSSCVISVVVIVVVRHSMWNLITKKIRLISLSDEKKKTKVVDSEVNPVWNEVTNLLAVGQTCSSVQISPWLLKSFALMTPPPDMWCCVVSGAGVWSEGHGAGLSLLHWCGCERLRDYWER